jgi:hypothetical protein
MEVEGWGTKRKGCYIHKEVDLLTVIDARHAKLRVGS